MNAKDASPGGEVLVYEAPDGEVRVDVRLERETVWLSQKQMSQLFATTPENITMHLKKVFGDGELDESTTAKEFLVVRTEGKRRVERRVKHYNLDGILSVGYRVNSKRGVRFRQWATQTLREHLVRGFTVHRQRFEANARELEATLALLRKTASGPALTGDQWQQAHRLFPLRRLPESQRSPVRARRAHHQRRRARGPCAPRRRIRSEGQGRHDSLGHEHARQAGSDAVTLIGTTNGCGRAATP